MHPQKQPSLQYPISPQTEDEIDLVALLGVIWQGKWILLALVTFCLLASFVYLELTPKQYQVSENLYPLDAIQMAPVAPGNGGKELGYGVNIQDPNIFFRSALDSLGSLELQKQFWKSQFVLDDATPLEDASLDDFLRFRHSLDLSPPQQDRPASLSIRGNTPALIADRLTAFLNYVSTEVAVKSISKLLRAIDVSIERIDLAILQARTKADAEISDQIVDVREALEIATSLGIEEPEFSRLANVEITLFNSRQYLLGTKALKSELQALERRRNQDAFVPSLRELQDAKASLLADRERISRNVADFRPFTYSDSISPPLQPIGPKSTLILAMAVVFGLILGLVAIFIRHGIQSYKAREAAIVASEN
ncbi:hypothetical protein FKG94_06165 [Exilibacterium tricleocarpae]|uniref:Polysaccharide chain length determinant N-terminal domain-containing protein n=1 Tax=Exilibacterium tricleocarpae TaxID=2591008 RepID=A0A545U448_9GAMM|nr:Wzz/FepE/Etk N-terminal domain-containing protein [Exilibacterium tricleocarpae]TQV84240.1 hypothetical protein FKG94_06165 [Exilibacterium tricleocarpae]